MSGAMTSAQGDQKSIQFSRRFKAGFCVEIPVDQFTPSAWERGSRFKSGSFTDEI
jgi:hypothetical protein